MGANIGLANGRYVIGAEKTAQTFRGQNVAAESLGHGVVIHMSGTTDSIVGNKGGPGKSGYWHPCLAKFVHALPATGGSNPARASAERLGEQACPTTSATSRAG